MPHVVDIFDEAVIFLPESHGWVLLALLLQIEWKRRDLKKKMKDESDKR